MLLFVRNLGKKKNPLYLFFQLFPLPTSSRSCPWQTCHQSFPLCFHLPAIFILVLAVLQGMAQAQHCFGLHGGAAKEPVQAGIFWLKTCLVKLKKKGKKVTSYNVYKVAENSHNAHQIEAWKVPIGGESWEWKVLLTQRLHSGAAAGTVLVRTGTTGTTLYSLHELKLQVHEVVSCALLTVPPALCDDPDELSLFLMSQKLLCRRGVEPGEGTVMLVTETAQASWPGQTGLLSPSPWWCPKQVFS